ncbi:MAG: glutamate 5-kinase [Clostridiales bacterium]|nr:glutamate 5-kinase [Clostridiales bacterium]
MSPIENARRVVIKVGTSTLTYENGRLNLRRVEALCRVLADLKNAGREVTLVTSGAIGVGAGHLGLKERPRDIGGKQAAAAVGQCELMYIYDKQFSEYGHVTAQVLLTRDVMDDDRRRRNVVNTLTRLLEYGAIPIINENDTVAVEEIEFGDNDTLSAMVAELIGAQALILLTDIDGLYDADPRRHPEARRIPVVEQIDDRLRALAGGAGSSRGTGGMITKLNAAQIAMQAGIPAVIMNGAQPFRLYDLFDGRPRGTLFLPGGKSDDSGEDRRERSDEK